MRFNANKLLLDPYARALAGRFEWHESVYGFSHEDGADRPMHATALPMFTKPRGRFALDWGDDHSRHAVARQRRLRTARQGFTHKTPRRPEQLRASIFGLAQPGVIAYFKRLASRRLNCCRCRLSSAKREHIKRGLSNYWGYNSVAYFAPAVEYAVSDPVGEFKRMVKALQRARASK